MIEFIGVTKRYGNKVAVEDINLEIEDGEFVFLVGKSGAGKSTCIKLLLKEVNADEGTIIVDGRVVTKMPNRLVPKHRRNIGIVFQDFRLLPKKTVFENVAFAMNIIHKSRRNIRNQVPEVLSLVGIQDKAFMFPDQLSEGEQQRVAIARAIVNNPSVLIADEPTGNLDPETAWGIMDLLQKINDKGTTIVMVTHAKDIVDRMGKRVIAIEGGRIVRDSEGAYIDEEATMLIDYNENETVNSNYRTESTDLPEDYDTDASEWTETEEA